MKKKRKKIKMLKRLSVRFEKPRNLRIIAKITFLVLFLLVSCIPRMLFAGEEKINGSTYFVRVTESFGPSIKILHAMMGHQF